MSLNLMRCPFKTPLFIHSIYFIFLFFLSVPTAFSSIDTLDPLFKEIAGVDVINGKPLSFQVRNQKQIQILVFLSTQCPCSRSYLPELSSLAKEFKSPEFQFIGILSNVDEKPDQARIYFEQAHLPFPVIWDESGTYAELFGALATPHAFVVGTSGEILYRGGVADSRSSERARNHYLKSILEKIKKRETVSLQERMPFGCSVRTKKRGW